MTTRIKTLFFTQHRPSLITIKTTSRGLHETFEVIVNRVSKANSFASGTVSHIHTDLPPAISSEQAKDLR